MAKKKLPHFRNLTAREKRELARGLKQWRRKMQPMIDAIDESTRITGDDLNIWIGPAPLRDELSRRSRRRSIPNLKPSP